MFGYFIGNTRTDIYNIIFYITAYDRQQPIYVDYARSSGGIAIPNIVTKSALKSLGATLNFIHFWIKYFQHNYQER